VNKTVTDFGGIYTDIPPSLRPCLELKCRKGLELALHAAETANTDVDTDITQAFQVNKCADYSAIRSCAFNLLRPRRNTTH